LTIGFALCYADRRHPSSVAGVSSTASEGHDTLPSGASLLRVSITPTAESVGTQNFYYQQEQRVLQKPLFFLTSSGVVIILYLLGRVLEPAATRALTAAIRNEWMRHSTPAPVLPG